MGETWVDLVFGAGFFLHCQLCLAILILRTNSLYESVQSSIWLPIVLSQNMSPGKNRNSPDSMWNKNAHNSAAHE